jgi:hypothetical protein
LIKVKMVVLAPMQRARVTTPAREETGEWTRERAPWRTSLSRFSKALISSAFYR